jgi:putative tricarboxylic transport membrane protein
MMRWADEGLMGKYSLRNGDVLSGAVLAALGVYIVLQAHAWNYYSADGPGPGFFPTWYGLLMVVLALLLVVKALLRAEPAKTKTTESGTVLALATWVAFAAAVALMGPLGFLLSFALFTFFLVAVVFRRPLVTAVVTAIGTAVAFHLAFVVALGVELPTGFLGF